MTSRLDNFTDAAFAFGVTLLVIGGGDPPTSVTMLHAAVADVPAFAIGFAIIAMFWFAHLRWRRVRGEGGRLSMLLTVLLIFLVLIYVQPLRAMAQSFSTFLGGGGQRFEGSVADLFFVYGLGFVAMATTTAGLFLEALRSPALDDEGRRSVRGEVMIWLILVATGLVSVLLTFSGATANFAPSVYATLPISIGLFTWRYDWGGEAVRMRK